MLRVLVLLDVDGVVSPLFPRHREPEFDDEWVAVYPHFRMYAHRDVVRWLRWLDARDGIAVAWLSSWEGEATALASALGTSTWRAYTRADVNPDVGDEVAGWWKARVVWGLLEGHPDLRVVWCDDDINIHRRLKLRLRQAFGDRVLVVIPQRELGLTATAMSLVDGFITENA